MSTASTPRIDSRSRPASARRSRTAWFSPRGSIPDRIHQYLFGLYPTAEYSRFEEQVLGELNPLSRHGRMMRRRFHGRSHDETLDSAGRVRIPGHLIEHADLKEGPCVVIGVADHLEIWNTRAWGQHDAEIDETATEIAEELAGGGPGSG